MTFRAFAVLLLKPCGRNMLEIRF